MENKAKNSVNVAWIGLGLGVSFWFIESFVHLYLFRETNLLALLLTPPVNELWMRLLIIVLITSFGLYSQFLINRYRQAQKRLQKSVEFNSILLSSFPNPMFVLNTDKSLKYINPTMEKMTGFSLDETVGCKPPYPWCAAKTSSKTNSNTCNYVERAAKGLEKLFTRKNGETFWAEITSTPVTQNDEIKYFLASWIDITKRKQAQQELEENEMFYRSLTESVSDGVMLIQNNKISFVNNAFVNLFGSICAEKLIDLNPISLFNNEFENVFVKINDVQWHEQNQKNLPKKFAFFLKGEKRWIATNIKDINLISRADTIIIFKDITEEMLREIAIQEEAEQIRQENVKLRASIKERFRFGNIIGKSSVMQQVYELALKAASTDANVSILGESGTGKELLARAVHDMGNGTKKAFVPVNCGAIPEALAESEFFGHVKGAFTGAHINKNGYLHMVNQGTMFLDEVGELSLKMQAKLLRALDSGEYTPVGSTRYQKSNFRIISATNKDISEMVNQGLMREDFYYRLNVIPITLPPLRERKEDIPLLIEHFLSQYGNGKTKTLSGKTIDVLCSYHWPGNVRELQNIIQRYLTVGRIDILKMNNNDSELKNEASKNTDLKNAVINFEKQHILRALNQNEWNRCQTAATLNINVRTLYEKMKKCGLRNHTSG